ncbi:FecR domain-containing protein [Janthinobacterium psychrotolerans]|uniref:Transmembrane sensor n=1 Tax=Janthinobacterium psychrotolerans TaxID=1747903 RepID=A0A1A7C858_9BURK|nr:FecR domain-containing protein [Janthinobacterium psychrotolerans]OBV40955.1 transmembrane sensor [Janthinobacterium psychrotolerans]
MRASIVPRERYIVLQQAAEWFALLASNEAGETERAKWQCWLNADPLHADTWRQVQAISGQFRSLPAAPARAALAGNPSQGRRAFAAMLVAAASGLALWRRDATRYGGTLDYRGSHASGVGQLRQLGLPDGGQLLLDTDSLVDIDYGARARRIVLRQGRIQISTAVDTMQPARPLLVRTAQGSLRALGTRFEVRQDKHLSLLRVQQGAVEITPRHGPRLVVPAGQGVQFGAGKVAFLAPVGQAAPAWTRRMLLADNMRLADFVQELSRYRHGYLGCDPQVANLRLVGAYPLDDQDAILALLEASLPVQVRRTMPWWVTIAGRDAAQ